MKGPERKPPSMIGSQSFKGQEALLSWCRTKIQSIPSGVEENNPDLKELLQNIQSINNYTTAWSNGFALR